MQKHNRLNHKKWWQLLIVLGACCFASAVRAETMKATDLQEHCFHVQQGIAGRSFNEMSAHLCTAYINGFFDTLIIVDKLAGKPQLCALESVPTLDHIKILDAWIQDNQDIAPQTTAAVALFAAFKKAFPCF